MLISLVVPVFNEEDNVLNFHNCVRDFFKESAYAFEIVFVNDGSKDQTEKIILDLERKDSLVQVISFTRNFGKEAALFAGIEGAKGDAVIPMDVDLQDPIEVIPQLIERWEQGAQIVLAKRVDRSADGFLKRTTASLFYYFHNQISTPKIEPNVGDFRLISRVIVVEILKMQERNLFMKGILSWSGGVSDIVEYSRPDRKIGKSKFGFWKLWNLAIEGVTSFSTFPLRIWSYIGCAVAAFSLLYSLFIVFKTLFLGSDVDGYPSLLVSILFLGGVQLIGIGVLGE